jgi:hypothetical protein
VRFDQRLAEIRFGCGLSPEVAAPQSVQHMLSQLQKPDSAAAAFPISGFAEVFKRSKQLKSLNKIKRKSKGSTVALSADAQITKLRRTARNNQRIWFRQQLQRRISTKDGLRERLIFSGLITFQKSGLNPSTLVGGGSVCVAKLGC